MSRFVALAALCLSLAGCAVHRPRFQTVHFRNCQITDQRDNLTACDCRIADWILDAKDPNALIAVCAGPEPIVEKASN